MLLLRSVSKILGLAWITLRKWPPMPSIVFYDSQFFCQKTTCHVRNIIICAKLIYIKIFFLNFAAIRHGIFSSLKVDFFRPTALEFSHHEIGNKDIF